MRKLNATLLILLLTLPFFWIPQRSFASSSLSLLLSTDKDTYFRQETVFVTTRFLYEQTPIPNALVALEVAFPDNTSWFAWTNDTNENGFATFQFLLPQWIPSGEYTIYATTYKTGLGNASKTTKFTVLEFFDIWLSPDYAQTSVGGNASFTISVKNNQKITDRFSITLRGLNSSWYQLTRNSMILLPQETGTSNVIVSVPEDPAFAGIYQFSVNVTSSDGTAQARVGVLEVLLTPIIYNLTPQNSTICSSREVVFHWRTSSNSTSEIYIKPSDESLYTQLISSPGFEHTVIARNLSRGTEYTWYAASRGVGGITTSELRTLLISNGVVFTKKVFSFTIERDYSQIVQISVRNTESETQTAMLSAINPYNDLIAQFIGSGSIDQNITLAEGETASIDLAIHAQDTVQTNYTLTVQVSTLGAQNRTDYAIVFITVRQPLILLEVRDVFVDPETLIKTLSVINHGDMVSDLAVKPDDASKSDILIDPVIDHTRLETGQSLSFRAIPLLYEGFTNLTGNLIVTAAGTSFTVPINFTTPPGKSVFLGTVGFYDHYNYTHVLPIDSTVFVEQILEDAVTVHVEAVYNSTLPILVFENVTREDNTFTVNVQSMEPYSPTPNITGRYVHTLIGNLSTGNYTLHVRESTLGITFLSKNFTIEQFGTLFESENMTVTLTPYKGAFENGTYYLSKSPTIPLLHPSLFGNTSFWVNSTDNIILGFMVKTSQSSISNITFSIFTSTTAISIEPRTLSFEYLNPNSPIIFIFECSFANASIGVHELRYSFNYTKEGAFQNVTGKLPVGVYKLEQTWEDDDTLYSMFISPFGDTLNRTSSSWHLFELVNGTFWWPYNVTSYVSYSNFTLEPPHSPLHPVLVGAIIGGIVGAGAEALTQWRETGKIVDLGLIAKEGVKGAAKGAWYTWAMPVAIASGGIYGAVALRATTEATVEAIDQLFTSIWTGKDATDFGKILYSGFSGAILGAFSYGARAISARVALERAIRENPDMYTTGSWKHIGDLWNAGQKWLASFEYLQRAVKVTRAVDVLEKYLTAINLYDLFYERQVTTYLWDNYVYPVSSFLIEMMWLPFKSIGLGDADGDGWSNLEELRAGTNPFDPTSSPGVSLAFSFSGSYCTNMPIIKSQFGLPSTIEPMLSPIPNVDSAILALRFDLRGDPDTYRPHNVHISLNEHEIGQLVNVVPEGTYIFEFDPMLLNYAESGLATNTITITAEDINVGAFVRSSNIKILLHMKTVKMFVVASSQEEANEILEKKSGTVANMPDFSVYPEDIIFSNSTPAEDEIIKISAKITNVGTAGFRNVPVEFIDNGELIQRVILPKIDAYETQIASIHWKCEAGVHSILVKVNSEQLIPETTYSNNQASKSVRTLAHDVAIISVTPHETVVGQGYSLLVHVTVENQGDFPENFNLTCYANTTEIGTQSVTNLGSGNQATLTFNWNTTGVSLGIYTISANASIVQGETYITDNTYIDGTVKVAKNPVADANGPYSDSEGFPITFDASGSTDEDGAVVLYEWDWDNDGSYDESTTSPLINHTWSDDYTGTVGLRVTDSDGLSHTATAWVTVYNVAPMVEAGPDQTADEGSPVTFSGIFTDPGTADTHTYFWDFGDGTNTTGTLTLTHAYGDNGVYTVTLNVTDDDGESGVDTLTVIVYNVAPTVNAGLNQTVYINQTVYFDGNFTDPGWLDTHTIFWDFDDGTNTTGTLTPTHSYTAVGVYTVTLNVTDDDGESGVDTINITVSAVPVNDVAILSVTPSATKVIQGSTVNITVLAFNEGSETESFNITAYANTTLIDTFARITVTSGNSTTIIFTWNTTGFAKGNYTLSATASPVPGETDLSDNTYTDGIVEIISQIVVIIDNVFVSDNRTDVNSTQWIGFHAKWSNESHVISGIIYVNQTSYITNQSGWITIGVRFDTVGNRTWTVTGVSCNDVTTFEQSISNPWIIWDRVQVTLNALDTRVDVNTNASITWTGIYEYDSTNFSGSIALNDTAFKDTIGRYGYTVQSIQDLKYNLTAFTSNAIYIIFDRVSIILSVEDFRIDVGTMASIVWTGVYEYDGATFTGTVTYNDTETKNIVGKYGYTVSSISDPLYGITSFEPNVIACVWDRIKIFQGGVSHSISNVTQSETIWFKAGYEYDNTTFDGIRGTLYVNGSAMTWSEINLRWEHTYSYFTVGNRTFIVSGVLDRQYGLTTIKDTVGPLSIAWVEYVVHISTPEQINMKNPLIINATQIVNAIIIISNISAPTMIQVTNVTMPAPPIEGLKPIGKPIGVNVTAPVTGHFRIRIYYSDEQLEAEEIDEKSLKIYVWNGTHWIPIVTSHVNPAKNYVEAVITHFSVFLLMGEPITRAAPTQLIWLSIIVVIAIVSIALILIFKRRKPRNRYNIQQ